MSALQIIHENGYTYNDLKPENIMVSNDLVRGSSNVNVKLIDYGFVNKYVDDDGKVICKHL